MQICNYPIIELYCFWCIWSYRRMFTLWDFFYSIRGFCDNKTDILNKTDIKRRAQFINKLDFKKRKERKKKIYVFTLYKENIRLFYLLVILFLFFLEQSLTIWKYFPLFISRLFFLFFPHYPFSHDNGI